MTNLVSGMMAKVRHVTPFWPTEVAMPTCTSIVTGCHPQGEFGSCMLTMTEFSPIWIPDQSLCKQKRNFYYIKSQKFGSLLIMETDATFIKNLSFPEPPNKAKSDSLPRHYMSPQSYFHLRVNSLLMCKIFQGSMCVLYIFLPPT